MMEEMRAALTVRVRDVAQATRWYAAVFGVPPLYEGVDRSLDGGAAAIACFRLGGVKLWVAKMPTGEERGPGEADRGMTIAFMTREPLAPLRRRLLERGALIRPDEAKPDFPEDENGVRQGRDAEFFYIYDPDGNRYEFCRLL